MDFMILKGCPKLENNPASRPFSFFTIDKVHCESHLSISRMLVEPLVTIRCDLPPLLCADSRSDVIALHCLVVSGATHKGNSRGHTSDGTLPDPSSVARRGPWQPIHFRVRKLQASCKSQYVVTHNTLQLPIFHQFCFLSSPSSSSPQLPSFSFKTLPTL